MKLLGLRPRRVVGPRGDVEAGTAMAELAVLLPVYLMLLVGVIVFGRWVLARQQVVEAARFACWQGTPGTDLSQFFGRFPRKTLSPRQQQRDFQVATKDVKDAFNDGRGSSTVDFKQQDIDLAGQILQGAMFDGQAWLQESQVTVEMSYPIITYMLGNLAPQARVSCKGAVITRTSAQWPTFQEGSRDHPIQKVIGFELPASFPSWEGWDPDFDPQ